MERGPGVRSRRRDWIRRAPPRDWSPPARPSGPGFPSGRVGGHRFPHHAPHSPHGRMTRGARQENSRPLAIEGPERAQSVEEQQSGHLITEDSRLLLTQRRAGSRLSGTAYDLNVHLVPEDDRIRGGHRRAVDDHPDAMARLGWVSEDLLGIEGLPPNPEEFAEGVFPRHAGLHMDLPRGVMGMEGGHPTHPIRHIWHRGVLVQRMVLPQARVDADVRGNRHGLTVNRDCQLRMPVKGPAAGRNVRIGDDDTSEYEGNRQNHDQHGARNMESRSGYPAFLLDD